MRKQEDKNFWVKWEDWPYSSGAFYLETMGREKAIKIWDDYPILDYGKDWDPPEL